MATHAYLSIACLHAQKAEQGEDGIYDPHHAAVLHARCKGEEGHASSEGLIECEFCAAKCACPCHKEATDVAS